jgi:hypothetical protein
MGDLYDDYLNLMKRTLTHSLWPDHFSFIKRGSGRSVREAVKNRVINFLDRFDLALVRRKIVSDEKVYEEGKGWPLFAETMIGFKRLENIRFCIEEIIKNEILGDLIETGVWRGGATIFMKAVLHANNINDRIVWVADSFEGLPKPDPEKYPEDKGDQHYLREELKINLETVQNNFIKYGLLDNDVKFLKGWFKDTLPVAPIKRLSLLRIDGDIYESTRDALINLYPKLSIGGYIIIDDFLNKSCVKAVEDYRNEHGIDEEIQAIDWTGVFWKRIK